MILLSMFFLHIVDDFYLQPGILSKLKQRDWWAENAPDPLYKYDYVMALLMHSFSWSFLIMLPAAYYLDFEIDPTFILMLINNMIIHGGIDHFKANEKCLNLVQDQLTHIMQIIATYMILVLNM